MRLANIINFMSLTKRKHNKNKYFDQYLLDPFTPKFYVRFNSQPISFQKTVLSQSDRYLKTEFFLVSFFLTGLIGIKSHGISKYFVNIIHLTPDKTIINYLLIKPKNGKFIPKKYK